MSNFEELKARLTEIVNKPVFPVEEVFAHDEWQSKNNIRYCNVFTLKDNQPVATLAISKGNDEEAIKEAIARLRINFNS